MSKHAEATAAALVAREQALAYLKERGLAKDQPVMERTKGDVNSVGTDNTVRMIRERNKAKAAAAAPVADDDGAAPRSGASAVRWTRLQDDASGKPYWWDSATGATSWSAPPGHAAETSGAADVFRRRSVEEAEGEEYVPRANSKFALLDSKSAATPYVDGWVAIADPASKRVYYWSSRSDEVQWDEPARADPTEEAKVAPPPPPPTTSALGGFTVALPPQHHQQQQRRAPQYPRALLQQPGDAKIGFCIGGGGGSGGGGGVARGRNAKRARRAPKRDSDAFDPLDPTGSGGRWADGLEQASAP